MVSVKKAQMTVEFLFCFLTTVAIISLLLMALGSLEKAGREHYQKMEMMVDMEEFARSLDAFAANGRYKSISIDQPYVVEKNVVMRNIGKKYLTTETLYSKGEMDGEPV